jgi:hypothetical protein
MAALEPVFTTVIGVVGGGFGITLLRYFGFFRKNRVEDRTTETERLEAENRRANERADKAEADAQAKVDKAEADELAMLSALRTSRRQLFDEEEYNSRLRAQLHSHEIVPFERGK